MCEMKQWLAVNLVAGSMWRWLNGINESSKAGQPISK